MIEFDEVRQREQIVGHVRRAELRHYEVLGGEFGLSDWIHLIQI
jgi:hypothetical protein